MALARRRVGRSAPALTAAFALALLAAPVVPARAYAQADPAPEPAGDTSIFRPLPWPAATPLRDAAGRPGPAY